MSDYADQLRISEILGWNVYVISEEGDVYAKVGTALNPSYRLSGLQGGNPRRLSLARVWHVLSRQDAFNIEITALGLLGVVRLKNRDWIRCSASEAIHAVRNTLISLNINGTEVRT